MRWKFNFFPAYRGTGGRITYVASDKSASIRFLKPGRSTLTARFVVTEEEIETIRKLCGPGAPIARVYNIEIVDTSGVPHAVVEKTIYIRKKSPPGDRSV